MEDLSKKYRLSTYIEVAELSRGKVYIVKSSIDDKIYIKKILESENQNIYEKIKELDIDNIPKIYEILNIEDELIVIEEYISGNSLDEILKEKKRIPQNEVISYTLDLIDIISKIHYCNPPIIHKDINPSNIMVNNDGIVKLIDFDISRVHCNGKTTDTHILGTYGYAAPEQFGFNQTDMRTDIYSLGVTMNIMLVGKLPNEEMYKGKLSKIISKCTEMDPNKRYKNVGELKKDLQDLNRKHNNINSGGLNYSLPGFKSGKLLFKILASFWYLMLIMASLGFLSEEPLSDGRILDIEVSSFLFALTLLYGNYRDVKSKLLFLKSSNIISKIFGYFLYTFLLFLLLSIAMPN